MKAFAVIPFLVFSFQTLANSQFKQTGVICRSFDGGIVINTETKSLSSDSAKAKEFGLCAMIIEKGKTFDTSAVAIYPKAVALNSYGKNVTKLKEFVELEIADFKKSNPTIQAVDKGILKVTKGEMLLYELNNGQAPNEFEMIAYTRNENSVFMVVMSARKKENIDKFLPHFKELLNSIDFIDSKGLFDMASEHQKEDEKRKGHKDYEKKFSMQVLAPNLKQNLAACSKGEKLEFKMIFQVDDNGQVLDVATADMNPKKRCVAQSFLDVKGPKPPFAPLHIGLNIK